jgi:hypothetical protein
MISDRPHARSALDHQTKRGLFDGFNSFKADDALALVLTGAGIRRSRNPLRSSAWKPSRRAVIHPGMRCAPVPLPQSLVTESGTEPGSAALIVW